MKSLYDNIYCANSIEPQSDAVNTTPVTGIVVDTEGFNTAVLRFRTSQSSSTPTAASLAVKLQEGSAADGSDMADALDNTGTVIGGTADAKNHAASEVLARIEGLGLNRKRYLRIVVTPTLTGGSSPTVIFFGEILLAQAFKKPTNTTVSNT